MCINSVRQHRKNSAMILRNESTIIIRGVTLGITAFHFIIFEKFPQNTAKNRVAQ